MSHTLSIQSFIVTVSLFTAMLYPVLYASAEVSPWDGQVVAIDAGHDSVTIGATGWCGDVPVPEYEVNLAVRAALVEKLAAVGATGYEVAQLDTRKERVIDAESSSSSVLISIHHNGSSNTNADYTQFFVTQKNDKELANAIYPIMVETLGSTGRGIKSDGYGMTVYGSLPGVLTESYFITNSDRACEFLNRTTLEVDIVDLEAQALFDGLEAYFAAQGSTRGGSKPDNGSGGGKGRNK